MVFLLFQMSSFVPEIGVLSAMISVSPTATGKNIIKSVINEETNIKTAFSGTLKVRPKNG